ncbi:MAG TPA: PPC domain-containing DNA-binding protein [Candidatus Limnocylindrales bacterium]|nr:PPC domain-containing DNA-binding protein [Candidatus Limnocylindrales bacterium]
MRSRLLTDGPVRTYAVVFDPGDEPLSGLVAFSRDHRIDAAHLTAIGAVSHATVGWFDLERRDYRRIELDEQLEVLSLVGDVTGPAPGGSDPIVHVHAVLGRHDGSAVGGHLLVASVRPTLEVLLTETPAELARRHDEATGLALIDIDASTAPAGTKPGGTHGTNRR